MCKNRELCCAKVAYGPLEAAIRWSNLLNHERSIARALRGRSRPAGGELKRWPTLQLNTERIFDAIVHGDLPFGEHGVTTNDLALLDSPDLTVRHVDLRAWMAQRYPGERPHFLFNAIEQIHAAISTEAVQALLVDRDATRIQLAARTEDYQQLVIAHEGLRKELQSLSPDRPIGPRSESTYLAIIGGLLTLLLGRSPAGRPYSSFRSTEGLIDALLAHHEGIPGISARTLWSKLAAAKRHIESHTR